MSSKNYARDSVVIPFAIPIIALLVIGVLVIPFARILLAVNAKTAVLIAVIAAVDVLVIGALIAYRRGSRPLHIPLIVLSCIVVVIGGMAAPRLAGRAEPHAAEEAAGPETTEAGAGEEAGAGAGAIEVRARSLAFDAEEIVLKAGAPAVIEFNNADSGLPHNIAIYSSSDLSTATTIFKGATFNGPAKRRYEFTAPAAGTYYFHCDVHPSMNGTVKVV